MSIRLLVFCILLTATFSASANEQIYLRFELARDENVIERGRAYVKPKPHTWSRGLKSSYLRLRCQRPDPEHVKKLLSTVDHFAGLRVTKQLVDNKIELTVVRTVVQARLKEIRALPKNECEDLFPVVTTTTGTYSIPAVNGANETFTFGEDMTFRVAVYSVGG